MSYLLEADTIAAILTANRVARQRLKMAVASADILVSAITVSQLWYAAAMSVRHKENNERVRIFLSGDISVAPFDGEDARIAAEIRVVVGRDLPIAAQALRHGATLVTANTTEFASVPGLVCENWTAG